MKLIEMKTRTLHYFRDQEGQYQGEFKSWHNNGQLEVQCFYVDNKVHGEYKVWWPNGKLERCESYYHDNRHGECKNFYDNGNLREHFLSKDAKLHGEYKCFNIRKKIISHCFYNNDKELCIASTLYPKTEEDRLYFTLKYDIPLLPVE